MGAKNRSSVTGSFELERITFTLGKIHAKTEESDKNGIMQLDLVLLTAHVNSFNQTTRITSKIADLRMKDLSSKSTAENKEIIKQTPTAISNDEVTQLPNDDQNNGLLHVTYDIIASTATDKSQTKKKSIIVLRMNSLEIVANLLFVSNLTNFFTPDEDINLDVLYFAAAERARKLQNVSAARAYDVLGSVNSTAFDIVIAPPTVIVPSDPTWRIGDSCTHGNDLLVILNLGMLEIRSNDESEGLNQLNLSLNDVVERDLTNFYEVSPEYERLDITIEGIEAIVASKTIDFRNRSVQNVHKLNLTNKINIGITLDTCIAPFHVETPATRTTVNIPEIGLEISSIKLLQLTKILACLSSNEDSAQDDMPETRSNKATLKENISDLSKKFGQKNELSASFKRILQRSVSLAAAVRIQKFSLNLSSGSDFVLGDFKKLATGEISLVI